jgi:ubiquinone/menaquinone biosynthesis C-methylase UbiE
MNTAEYHRMHEMEDHYWWFVARRRLALRLLGADRQRESWTLDLGCGTGVVSESLAKQTSIVGLDFSELALEYCRGRGLQNLCLGDAERLPLESNQFAAIVALDMFEHVRDDEAAFREAHRVLSPGGRLVLSVPAFPFLWGPHDVALMHFRRYRKPELVRKLERVGFRIERASYSVFLLFPLVCVIRAFEKFKRGEPKASLAPLPRWLNQALINVQALEHGLISKFNLPWGSSVVVLAVKE